MTKQFEIKGISKNITIMPTPKSNTAQAPHQKTSPLLPLKKNTKTGTAKNGKSINPRKNKTAGKHLGVKKQRVAPS